MRRLFLFLSMGILSIGALTGCSVFRGPDDACKCKVNQDRCTTCQSAPASKTPVAVKSDDKAKISVAAKSDGKTTVRVGAEAQAIPVSARPAAPMPVGTPAVSEQPLPPPRMPSTETLPAIPLPPPPPWKTSAAEGAVPADKIVIVSSLDTNSTISETRDLIDVSKPRPTIVQAMHTAQVAPKVAAAAQEPPSAYGHDEKFASITGQVQEYRKTRRLRYAAVDQEDIYGGIVTLEGNVDLSRLREGQRVRVRGVLIPPTERNESARYRVMAFEVLD